MTRSGLPFRAILVVGCFAPSAAAEPVPAEPSPPQQATPPDPQQEPEKADALEAEQTIPSDPLVTPKPGEPAATTEPTSARGHVEDALPSARGLHIALRLGWGIPQGAREGGDNLAELYIGMVPLWLDLGYRISKALWLGIYAQYGFVILNSCPSNFTCRGSDVRFGLQAQWHFGARAGTDPWVGVHAGYELLNEDVADDSASWGGVELFGLQLGEDFALGNRFSFGPFVTASLGRYLVSSQQLADTAPTDGEVANKSYHVWVVLGVRFSFGA